MCSAGVTPTDPSPCGSTASPLRCTPFIIFRGGCSSPLFLVDDKLNREILRCQAGGYVHDADVPRYSSVLRTGPKPKRFRHATYIFINRVLSGLLWLR